MHMDAARFSPGRWVDCVDQIAGRRALRDVRQRELRAELAWGWGNAGAASCLRCVVTPARCAHPCAYAVRSRARPQPRATCPGVEALCRTEGEESLALPLARQRARGL